MDKPQNIGGVLRIDAAPKTPSAPQPDPPPKATPRMSLPTVIMVGADKGGVGKTTVSRALADWLTARRIVHSVFDTESPEGDLRRFCPSSRVIDIEDVRDQMAVFDGVEFARVTMIDIRAGLLSPTLRALDAVKLLDDVRSGAVELVLLHVLGPTVASLSEIANVSAVVTGARYVLIKNHPSADVNYHEWETDERFKPVMEQLRSRMIELPYLKEEACERMQRLGLSFEAFANDKGQSRTLRGYVRSWLDVVWSEFDRIGIVDWRDTSLRAAAE